MWDHRILAEERGEGEKSASFPPLNIGTYTTEQTDYSVVFTKYCYKRSSIL
jgi:hypothetical protein